jgi:hypothetical protein
LEVAKRTVCIKESCKEQIIKMEEAARIQKIREAKQMTPAKALELNREFD